MHCYVKDEPDSEPDSKESLSIKKEQFEKPVWTRQMLACQPSHCVDQHSPMNKRCINLSGKAWDDAALERWLREDAITLVEDHQNLRFDTIDLSGNKLTDKGLQILVNFFLDHKVGVKRLKLFSNQFCEATSIGWLIEDREVGAGMFLCELHFSDNKLSTAALHNILECLRYCSRIYKGFDSPFWLRVELNEALVGLEELVVKEYREKGLKICMEAASKSSACKLQCCQHGADIHLILRRRLWASTKNHNTKALVSDSWRSKVSLNPRKRSRTKNEERARSRSRSRQTSPGSTQAVNQHSRREDRWEGRNYGEDRWEGRNYGLDTNDYSRPCGLDTNDYSRPCGICDVQLAGKSLGWDDLRRWCSEDGPRFISMHRRCAWNRLDLSRNDITDRGVGRLVRFLQDNRQAVVRLMLFMNQLVEPGTICNLIEDSELGVGAPGGLAELHLSSNSITLPALRRIIESLWRRARDCGPFKQPVWLRAERNPSLEDEGSELAKEYWTSDFKICLEGGRPESGCSISYCRYHADVHLHLFGANRANRERERDWRW